MFHFAVSLSNTWPCDSRGIDTRDIPTCALSPRTLSNPTHPYALHAFFSN